MSAVLGYMNAVGLVALSGFVFIPGTATGCASPNDVPSVAHHHGETPQSKVVHEPTEPVALSALLASGVASDRDIWWLAVQRLGELGGHDDDLRSHIWNQVRVNSVGMKFVELPPGTFTMGPDTHRIINMQVAHDVKLSKGFFISVTEVTNAQFKQLFPDFERDETYSPDSDSPAVNITWDMAVRYCRLLSEREGVGYRLPTEAEWEYACRAGSTSRFCFGDDLSILSEFCWCDESIGRASSVARLKPNAWGIYDMHGNVIEWVSDWFSNSYYANCAADGIVEDPQGPLSGRTHVLRSVPWHNTNLPAFACTVRFPRPLLERVPFDPNPVKLRQMLGFRVVRELDD